VPWDVGGAPEKRKKKERNLRDVISGQGRRLVMRKKKAVVEKEGGRSAKHSGKQKVSNIEFAYTLEKHGRISRGKNNRKGS